jgi:hypothetical protein
MQHRPVIGTTTLERQVRDAGAAGDVRLARVLPGLPQALPANVVQLLGVDDVHGASAAGVGSYLTLIDAAEPGSVAARKYFRAFRDPAIATGHVLDLLNVGLVLANVALPSAYAPIGGEDGLTLYRNPDALPRFFLAGEVERYATPEEGRARLLSPEFDPRARVLVAQQDAGAQLPDAPTPPGGRVAVRSRTPHAITLEVDAPAPAVLASSEVFYPGWETRVDGAPAPTLLVNTAFRGTVVPAGRHEVVMQYVPHSFRLGLALSLATLLVVAALWWPRRTEVHA